MASVRAARPIVSRHSESSFTVRLHANPTQPTLALWGVERDAPAKGEAGGTDRVSLSLFAESLDSFFVLAKGGLFGGGGYFIVAPRGQRTLLRGQRTPAAWWRSLWSFQGGHIESDLHIVCRHVPHAPLMAGFIVCVSKPMSDKA